MFFPISGLLSFLKIFFFFLVFYGHPFNATGNFVMLLPILFFIKRELYICTKTDQVEKINMDDTENPKNIQGSILFKGFYLV